MYKLKTTDLFEIQTDELVIGNYKYGKIVNAFNNKLFSDGDDLFSIKINKKKDSEINLQSIKTDKLSFYNFNGRFNDKNVTYERNFALGENAILHISDILSDTIYINYTEKFRIWTLSRFSKMKTIGNYLTDITTLRLLKNNILSFHGAAFEYLNRGYVITSLPDMGKSFTILKLLENKDINFMAEDIMMIDQNTNIISVPFTQTIEKRKKLDTVNELKSKFHEYFYKDNYVKSDVFEAINLPTSRLAKSTKLNTVFFLKRGKSEIKRLENKEDNFKILRDLNNLEFSYWRNELILTFLFFQPDISIYDFMEIENSMLKDVSENIDIIEVTAETYDRYYPLILNWIQNDN